MTQQSNMQCALAHGPICPQNAAASQQWLVEDLFPLGAAEVAWSDDQDDFNYELIELGFQVGHPVDERPRWRGQRGMTCGAAALIYGGERVLEGVSGRSIMLDPKRPKRGSLLWPFLPHGFGHPGHSIPAWTWLTELAQATGAAVVVTLDSPGQMKRMWRKGIRIADTTPDDLEVLKRRIRPCP